MTKGNAFNFCHPYFLGKHILYVTHSDNDDNQPFFYCWHFHFYWLDSKRLCKLNIEQMLVFLLHQQIGYQVTFLTACWPFLTSPLKLAKNLTFTLTKEYSFLMTTEQRTISAEDRLSEHLPAISRPKAASCHRSQLFVDIFQLYWLQTIDITVVDVLASISERRTDVRRRDLRTRELWSLFSTSKDILTLTLGNNRKLLLF